MISLFRLNRNTYYVLLGLLLVSLMSSCQREVLLRFIQPAKKFAPERTPHAPHYALASHWHFPQQRFMDKRVDVFYVHPTTYIKGKTWNQHLDNKTVNQLTRSIPIRYQATAFYDSCNVFMPKYRQAVFSSFVDHKGNGAQALALAYEDVRTAFQYYMTHHNQGRPFFLAGHSQGSRHLKQLLTEIWSDSTIQDQLIAAYLVGWPVEVSYVAQTPAAAACSTATQTGCLVSWNAQSPTAKTTMAAALQMNEPMLCTNPLSWQLDTTYVPPTANRGALMINRSLKEPELLLHYCGAQVNNGIVEVTPRAKSRRLLTPLSKGNYHLYDYNFFYQSIKENIAQRITAYFQENPLEQGPMMGQRQVAPSHE